MGRSAYPRLAAALAVLAAAACAPGQSEAPTRSVGPSQPEPGTLPSLDGYGSYEVRRYADLPDVPEFAAATVYYPADAPGPIGGVAIAPGFTEVQRHIDWWGPRLASHGYAVLLLDTNDRREQPDARASALLAGVTLLRAEGRRQGSPLFGRIDEAKMAVMGHSMGGGGALLAAHEHSDQIRAAIPFTPWEPGADLSGITAPTLILAGADDQIAEVAEHAWRHLSLIPASTPKVYLEVAGGDHFIADTTRGTDLATIGRYAIAWLKLYVDRDERYRNIIYGELPSTDAAKFSRYVTNP